MPPLLIAVLAGIAAGLVASFVMNLYQSATASLFGQDGGDGEPATVKAADGAKQAVGGRKVTQKRRQAAGTFVHYALGTALGVFYAVLVLVWPAAAIGFGIVFGLVVAIVLDDLLVPAFGWGTWPWQTSLAIQGYSLSSHIVFGAVLEGIRRLVISLA